MDELDENALGVLFKSLVFLDDKEQKKPVKSGTAAEQTFTEQKETADISDTPENVDEIQVTSSEDQAETASKYPDAKYLVIVPKDLISKLLDSESNFRKIIGKLELSHLTDHIIALEDIKDTGEISKIPAIWCIGLNAENLESIKTTNKLLHSPDPEREMDQDEKLALYLPIREFASNLK